MNRYARQEGIAGWDQSRLAGATVAIAGSGPLAFLSALMATAMGFGRLVLMGRPRGRGESAGTLPGLISSPVSAWARFLYAVNPQVEVFPICSSPTSSMLGRVPHLDGLIVAGNEPASWETAMRFAGEGGAPVVAGGSAGQVGIWGPPRLDRMVRRLQQLPESPVVSQIVAGLLVEDMRKALLPLPDEAGPSRERQCLALPALARGEVRGGRVPARRLGRAGVTVIGAGALANWFGLSLGLTGSRQDLHIYDADEIEETNLNRQVLFAHAVGKPKAPTLAARLDRLFPSLNTYGYGLKIEKSRLEGLAETSVVASCPDNFEVRALVNDWVRGSGRRILVNGGTSAWGGSSMTYAPGATCCLSCLMDIDGLARRESEAQGCAGVAEASVVTSNAIVGALMAWAVRDLFTRGKVRAGIWEYDGKAEGARLGVHSIRPPCACHLKR